MPTTFREVAASIHGILFGGFFLMAFFAALVELARSAYTVVPASVSKRGRRLDALFLTLMAACGWFAVITDTFLVYPWYRATPPAGTQALTDFPRSLLLSQPATAALHSIGMEWKEHVGWFAPILATMVTVMLVRHRAALAVDRRLRNAVIVFALVGVAATAVAGLTGALLDKAAPVKGDLNLAIRSTR